MCTFFKSVFILVESGNFCVFWPFLANYFVNLCTIWCTFNGLNNTVEYQSWWVWGMCIKANFFQICSPSGSKALHKEAKSTDKTLKVISYGFYHYCIELLKLNKARHVFISDGRRGTAQSLCWEGTNQKRGHQGHGELGGVVSQCEQQFLPDLRSMHCADPKDCST